jgi:hypothetical protein
MNRDRASCFKDATRRYRSKLAPIMRRHSLASLPFLPAISPNQEPAQHKNYPEERSTIRFRQGGAMLWATYE